VGARKGSQFKATVKEGFALMRGCPSIGMPRGLGRASLLRLAFPSHIYGATREALFGGPRLFDGLDKYCLT
jgi:hypothetical protein